MLSLKVVLSGFFDSVGLYRHATGRQIEAAEEWMNRMHLGHLKDRRFDHLSYGERRAVLLARAVVKTPELLVLDEPCQGLDPVHRRRMLDLIDEICTSSPTQLLYTTHRMNEFPACVTHVLNMETKQKAGSQRTCLETRET
jgi:molybdate transport system ATP-binding protein